MVLQHHSDFGLYRILRSNFSDGAMNYSSSNSYDYHYYDFSDYCSQSKGKDWTAILTLIFVFFGVSTSIIYLTVVMRRYTANASNFCFLNNFFLATIINLLSGAVYHIVTFRSYCWYGGRLLCKALPTIFDSSENAMTLFIVAIILEQNHPQIHTILSKNTKLRKRNMAIILWFVTIVLAIPEVFIWDVSEYSGNISLCNIRTHRHVSAFVSKGVFIEYLLPLLLLLVAVIHAAVVSSKRSNLPAANPAPEDTTSHCPPIRVTSIVIGVVVFVTRAPKYVRYFLHVFFYVHSKILASFSIVLYPVPSIVAPVLVLFSSPIHKKRLKETYQSIISCIAGRYVKEGFLLSEENERLEDIEIETESK